MSRQVYLEYMARLEEGRGRLLLKRQWGGDESAEESGDVPMVVHWRMYANPRNPSYRYAPLGYVDA